MDNNQNLPSGPSTTLRDCLILVALTLACLLPFVGKAFNIDDPMYLWAAEHILAHPLDFYGFAVNWEGYSMPMPVVMKNPPGVSYYIAGASLVTGMGEVGLHIAFLLQAVAVSLGTYFLARRFTSYAVLAALATVLTPVYLVSGTTLMADMLTLAFWVWAVYFWVRGLDTGAAASLAASGLLVAAATLTKYPGMSLIPLLLAYALISRRRFALWAPWIALPVVLLALYQWATYEMYGQGLLFAAASYAGEIRQKVSSGFLLKGALGLSFAGGSYITALFFAPFIWRGRILAAMAALPAVFFLILMKAGGLPVLEFTGPDGAAGWWLAAQAAVFMLAGVNLLALPLTDTARRRDLPSMLLLLWVLGTFVFSAFVNWAVNVRTMMPMAPAVGILIARGLEDRWAGRVKLIAWAPLIPALFVSLMVTLADYSLAHAARHAAQSIYARYSVQTGKSGSGLWFQGHWGFQHYVERAGGRIIDWKASRIRQGDIVVIPVNNYDIDILPMGSLAFVEQVDIPLFSGAATMYEPAGAAFYSSRGGPLPYAFGRVFEDTYLIMYAKEDLVLKF